MTQSTDQTLTIAGDGVTPSEPDHESPALRFIHSPDPGFIGREVALSDPVSLGRKEGKAASLVIADGGMSRLHATIDRASGKAGGWRVGDQGSKNGTFVGGQRIESSSLVHGDVLRVGDTLAVFVRRRPHSDWHHPEDEYIGASAELAEAVARLTQVAAADTSVLIEGETGTGKELAARHIHRRGGRRGPLIAVNCAAIPTELAEAALFGHKRGAFTGAREDAPGYFGSADGGTLFLDEVGELPQALQPKLLRALESMSITKVGGTREVSVDVRVIAATNVDLASAVERGAFRADLYARLAGLKVTLPPLRARRVDIPVLLRHFLELDAPAGARPWLWSADFVEALLLYRWPMNVRELRNLSRQVSATVEPGEQLSRSLIPEGSSTTKAKSADMPTHDALRAALIQHGGNVAKVAEQFGKARRQIYRWLDRYDLDPSAYR